MVNVGEPVANEEWQIINDSEHSLQEIYTMPEKEMDLEKSEIERRENTKLRILEWMHNLGADEKEAQSIQQVDVTAKKRVKSKTRCSVDKFFVRGVGVGLTHTENLMIKKLREVRETNGRAGSGGG